MTEKDLIENIIAIINLTNKSYTEERAESFEDICSAVNEYMYFKNKEENK